MRAARRRTYFSRLLDEGDIIYVSVDGRRVGVLWKNSARHNGLLLTEQCDNYCLMCSQPPKDRDDAWLFDRARKVISLLPPGARALSLTGGEPTLHADALIGLLEHCKRVAPELSLHLLTNGRRFADPEFTCRYTAVGLPDIMAGIPLYAPEPGLHDFIVQAVGAFNETVHGILNLASLGQAVEIRVVVQRHTVPVLAGSPYLTGVPPIRPLRPARPDPVGRPYGALAAAPLLVTFRDRLRRGSFLACRAARVVGCSPSSPADAVPARTLYPPPFACLPADAPPGF